MAPHPEHFVDLSFGAIVLLGFVALVVWACFAPGRGRPGRRLGRRVVGGLFVAGLVVAFLVSWTSIREHESRLLKRRGPGPAVEWVAPEVYASQPRASAVPPGGFPAAPTPSEVASLEALWDQLHQVRINLSEEDGTSAESDAGNDEATGNNADAPPRPAWVDQPARRVGEVYQLKLSAGPWEEVADCHRELEAKLRVAVAQRIEQLAGKLEGKSHVSVPALEKLGLGIDDVIRELCSEEYVETVATESFDEMKQVHVLMEFTPADDRQLIERWQNYRRRDRLAAVSLVASSVVGVLALAYGLLCVDTWTRGYYTKRLLLGVPAAIIMIVILMS